MTNNNEDISEDEIVEAFDLTAEEIDQTADSSGIEDCSPNIHQNIFSTRSTVGRNISDTEEQEIHSGEERDEQSSELKDMVDDILIFLDTDLSQC